MSSPDFRSTPAIGDDDRQLAIRPAGRDSISVKVGNQVAIVVDADELRRLVESAAEDCAAHVNETSTGGYLPRLPLPGESRKGDTKEPTTIPVRVWRVTGLPDETWPDDTLGMLYREREGRWETRVESDYWVASGWRGLKHMQGVGFELTEVAAPSPVTEARDA